MLSPDKPLYDDQVLIRYLLGATPEEETERLDELSVTDDEFAWRLSAAENELVDSYVNGELSGETLERFRSAYLSSAARREKVRFAEALLTGHRIAPTPASSQGLFRWFSRPRMALQWGFAAALMLLAGGFLLRENLRLRNQAAQVRAQELQRQIDAQRAAANPPVDAGTPSRELKTVSFVLMAQARGPGEIATVAAPPGTDRVAFRLELEADDFPAYEVALKNPATNQILWRSGRLKAASQGDMKAVSITLDAGSLQPRNYTFELTGIPARGAPEIVSGYSFRVAR